MNRETLTRSERVEEYSGENRIKKERSLQETTEGVNILLGDPRKAVVKLSIPIIVAITVIGSIITFIWAQLYLKCLMGTNKSIKKC